MKLESAQFAPLAAITVFDLSQCLSFTHVRLCEPSPKNPKNPGDLRVLENQTCKNLLRNLGGDRE